MALVPPLPRHCGSHMELDSAVLLCEKCSGHEEPMDATLSDRELAARWPVHCGEPQSMRRRIRCSSCGHTEESLFQHGRVPLDILPGSRDSRVFCGGNYDLIGSIRDVKSAVFQVGADFMPILPYDDYQIPIGQIYDSDLRLLHNCKYAIFEVSMPAGELFEIARCAEYKVKTLLVYQARGPAEAPPRARTMLLESGQHEHRSYRDAPHLGEIVREFLLQQEPEGWQHAVEDAGFYFESYELRHEIHPDGAADHNFQMTLRVAIPEFKVPQVTHDFQNTSGLITDFAPPDEPQVKWKEIASSDRARLGVVQFEPAREKGNSISYGFKMRTQGAYVLTRDDIRNVPPEELDDPFLASGREFASRKVATPIELLTLSVVFPDGYVVRPQPVAYFGAQLRTDALSSPPNVFTFEGNVATLRLFKPKQNFEYSITWEIPEKMTG